MIFLFWSFRLRTRLMILKISLAIFLVTICKTLSSGISLHLKKKDLNHRLKIISRTNSMFCLPGCSEKYFEPRNLQPHKYSNVDLFFRFVIHPTAIFDPLLKNDRNLKLASSILLFTNLYFVQRRP